MKRHKSCETECVLMRDYGQQCATACQKQQLVDDLYGETILSKYLKRKKRNQ